MTLVTQPVAGQPALLGFTGRTLSLVLILTVKAGPIQAMHGIGDLRKLRLLSAERAMFRVFGIRQYLLLAPRRKLTLRTAPTVTYAAVPGLAGQG